MPYCDVNARATAVARRAGELAVAMPGDDAGQARASTVDIGAGTRVRALQDLADQVGVLTIDTGVDHGDHDALAGGAAVHFVQLELGVLPLQGPNHVGLRGGGNSRHGGGEPDGRGDEGGAKNSHTRKIPPSHQGPKSRPTERPGDDVDNVMDSGTRVTSRPRRSAAWANATASCSAAPPGSLLK